MEDANRRLVTGCSQLVTLRGPSRPRIRDEMLDLSIIEDGAMAIAGGVILEVGPRNELEHKFPDWERIDAFGGVVLPGFVDAHTHPVFGGDRVEEFELRAKGATYSEIADRGGGILNTVRMTREATEAELTEKARKHASWFLANGTTTIEGKSGYGLSTDHELRLLRILKRLSDEGPLSIIPTFLGAHALPPEFEGRKQDYLQLVEDEMLPSIASEGLARFCDAFCEDKYFDKNELRPMLERAKSLGLGLRLHVDQLTQGDGAEFAASLGAATADHLEQAGPKGIQALARSQVQPVLLPGSVYSLGLTKYPNARLMIDAGLAVVLATDFNPGSAPTPSIPMVLSLASTQMSMLPAEALTAVTVNASYSLGLFDRGVLEPGRRADFTLFKARDYREIAYYFGASLLSETYVAGSRAHPSQGGKT